MLDLSRSLITIFSPLLVGMHEHLKSISFPATPMSKRPSWGFLRSPMSIPDMTLILETRDGWISLGSCLITFKIPSTLILIRT